MTTYAWTMMMVLGLAGPADAPAPDKSAKLPGTETTPAEPDDGAPAPAPDAGSTAVDASASDADTGDAPPPSTTGNDEPDLASPFANMEDDAPADAPSEDELPPPPRATPTPSVGVHKSAKTRPDREIRWRLDMLLGFHTLRIWNPTYLSLSDDRAMHGFDVGARFDWRIGQRLFLGGGATYSQFATARDIYAGIISSDVLLHEPQAHARASIMILEGLDGYVDVAGGPTIVKNTVTSLQRAADERTQVIGTFTALGGVAVYLPKQWLPNKKASRVTAGLDLGLGYQYRSDLEVATDLSLDEDPLDTSTVSYGTAAMRGLVFQLGLVIRVM